MTPAPAGPAASRLRRTVELTIDDEAVQVPEGITILRGLPQRGTAIPTLCYLETLHPVNVCRVCVVEVEGSRVLVPVVRPQGRAGHGGADRLGAGASQPQDGDRVSRLVGRPLDHAGRRGVGPGLSGGAGALRPACPASAGGRSRQPAAGPPCAAGSGVSRDGRPADQSRQRALRARLRQVRPVLQVRGGLREGLSEHLRAHRRGARVRCANLDRVRRGPSRVRVRVLRQLHRRLPHRRPDVQDRVRPPAGRNLGRIAADRDPDGLPVLRRRMQPGAARAGQRDRAR